MSASELVRQPSLSEQMVRILVERIKAGEYPPGSQLPPENVLSEEFKVSRGTIRQAYAALEDRSLVFRRRGVGTFVARSLSIGNPLFQHVNFEDRIASLGMTPGFQQLQARMVFTALELANKLEIEPGSPCLQIHKLWTADEQPIIYIINHIPVWVFAERFSQEEVLQPGFTEPIFDFFTQRLGHRVSHLTSAIWPCRAGACNLPAAFSRLDPDEPVLMVEDIGISEEGLPAFHSLEHLVGIASRFETVRRVM
jgi:DNA-binding GntR family transcriptional regulator